MVGYCQVGEGIEKVHLQEGGTGESLGGQAHAGYCVSLAGSSLPGAVPSAWIILTADIFLARAGQGLLFWLAPGIWAVWPRGFAQDFSLYLQIINRGLFIMGAAGLGGTYLLIKRLAWNSDICVQSLWGWCRYIRSIGKFPFSTQVAQM